MKQNVDSTGWAPTSYKWTYTPYSWPYKIGKWDYNLNGHPKAAGSRTIWPFGGEIVAANHGKLATGAVLKIKIAPTNLCILT